MSGQTFKDVCPLLLNDDERYTQDIRVGTDLQLATRNLPHRVSLRVCFNFFISLLGH